VSSDIIRAQPDMTRSQPGFGRSQPDVPRSAHDNPVAEDTDVNDSDILAVSTDAEAEAED
jgi:hypothetical protein